MSDHDVATFLAMEVFRGITQLFRKIRSVYPINSFKLFNANTSLEAS